jgi:hypothetical protein
VIALVLFEPGAKVVATLLLHELRRRIVLERRVQAARAGTEGRERLAVAGEPAQTVRGRQGLIARQAVHAAHCAVGDVSLCQKARAGRGRALRALEYPAHAPKPVRLKRRAPAAV